MKLENSVAVITGGGSGLGEATAREFLSHGAKVALLDLPSSPGAKLASELRDAIFCPADVINADQVSTALAQCRQKFGGVHILVNCAGIGRAQRTVTKEGPASLDVFNKVIQVNLVGTFNAIRLAAAEMAKNQQNGDGE